MGDFSSNVARTAAGNTNLNTLVPPLVRLRLFDPFMNPLPDAPYRIVIGDRTIPGTADSDGWVEIRVNPVPERCVIEFGELDPEPIKPPTNDVEGAGTTESLREALKRDEQGDPPEPEAAPDTAEPPPEPASDAPDELVDVPPPYLYQQEIFLQMDAETDEESLHRRLHNLGFGMWETMEQNIAAFQRFYDRPSAPTKSELGKEAAELHNRCNPKAIEASDSKWA